MTTEIMDHPPRLAAGAHEKGTGRACVMELVSWIHDPTDFTVWPACTAEPLAALLQGLNDNICRHRSSDELCSHCSALILPLGLKAMGTAPDEAKNGTRLIDWLRESAEIPLRGSAGVMTCFLFAAEQTLANPGRAVQLVSGAIDYWWTLIGGEPEPVAPETVQAAFEAVTA